MVHNMKKILFFAFFVFALHLYSEDLTEGNFWMVSYDHQRVTISPENFLVEEVKFIKKADNSLIMVFVNKKPNSSDMVFEEITVRQASGQFIIEEKFSVKSNKETSIYSTIYTGYGSVAKTITVTKRRSWIGFKNEESVQVAPLFT